MTSIPCRRPNRLRGRIRNRAAGGAFVKTIPSPRRMIAIVIVTACGGRRDRFRLSLLAYDDAVAAETVTVAIAVAAAICNGKVVGRRLCLLGIIHSVYRQCLVGL